MAKYEYWLTDEGLIKLEGWARDGLTDEQIANNIGIETRTLYRWKEKYSQICQSLKRGKDVIDMQVENALLKRALGYEYEEQTKEVVRDPSTGKPEIKIIKTVKKQVAPDVTAQIFWLKNRRPDKWRDKQDIEHTGTIKSEKFCDIISQIGGEGLDE